MTGNRDSKARLALATLAILIVGANFLDVSSLIRDWGIFLWILTVAFLCGSLVLFAYGKNAPIPGEFLLEPGLVLAVSFIFTFTVGGLIVNYPMLDRPSFFTDYFINSLNGLVTTICLILFLWLFLIYARTQKYST